MIFSGFPFSKTFSPDSANTSENILRAVAEWAERSFGVHILYDTRKFPFERPDLADEMILVKKLKRAGIIESIASLYSEPDEPNLFIWTATCTDKHKNKVGGISVESDALALRAMVAEALERYLWLEDNSYIISPTHASLETIADYGPFVSPERFCSFSPEQRAKNQAWTLKSDTSFLWILGESLVRRESVYIPAQTVSGIDMKKNGMDGEPLIRDRNTSGLATWPTKEGAMLAGAYEVIERDAYLIWWLNQLVLPRIRLEALAKNNPRIASLFEKCARYRLVPHVIKLITDAPANTVCVIVEDKSGIRPRFSFGMHTHHSLVHATEKATLEALRARLVVRRYARDGESWNSETPVEKIGHRERLYYWSTPENAERLAFLTSGALVEPALENVDHGPANNLEKIAAWCEKKKYEMVSVSLTSSPVNTIGWHTEVVVIPEMHAMYLDEQRRHFATTRISEVPKLFGYTPRKTPFADGPHPFS